ncbi:SWIM zinc finger family protein [Propioniciclava coleopterorum]|uniref:SWIM zinc finger family protein n=1 Tax=Propioniciclava coleopterorum TaxID=2714937 RepID=A0A6G7Y401_9ACTN|nr:SWIM zinc finger family protein [Propioniciclava coleopterorum]QIK71396.1 SWIM zinc finger family protein [Propioniciclava coleopterorum]
MTERGYHQASVLDEAGLSLALAPALTPNGPVASPSFFHGFATHPLVLARGLVTLADITAARYFPLGTSSMRDPVLTAHGDRLRAEVFSACAGVHARLDLLGAGFDGGEIGHGTTNVDIGLHTRTALSRVGRSDLLHVDVGSEGLAVSSPERTAVERPVDMPDRWVRSLGNTAEILHGLVPVLTVDAAAARAFIAALPAATAATRGGWVTRTRTGLRVAARPSGPAVFLAGTHRLSGLKRMLPHVQGLTLYGPAGGGEGASAVEVHLPAARLTLVLTAGATRGFSGEGALLDALASPTALEDAALVSALLSFEPRIDVARLARDADLTPDAVRDALAVLASSGRVGWDGHEEAWFHRELPDAPDRVTRDNPRLVAARRLVAAGGVRTGAEPGTWQVAGASEGDYLVRREADGDRCACTWYLSHRGTRGPCKHVLAAQIFDQEAR